MSQPPLAIGLGEVLWDLLPAGKQLGGAPANFAYHARQLGAEAVVVSAVGRDALGEEIRRRLDGLGIKGCLTIDDEHPTGTVSVKLDASGVPSYVIHQPVAWDFLRAGSPELSGYAARADVVCFGSLAQRSDVSRQTIRDFLAATGADCLRIFDINLRQNFFTEEVVRDSLAHAEVLKLSDNELPVIERLLGLAHEEGEAVGALLETFDLQMIVLTRGERGSSLYTPQEASHHPGYATAAVDTVGAGDAFTAAVATGLLRGLPLDDVNDAANQLAGYVCSQPGATPAIPNELRRLLE